MPLRTCSTCLLFMTSSELILISNIKIKLIHKIAKQFSNKKKTLSSTTLKTSPSAITTLVVATKRNLCLPLTLLALRSRWRILKTGSPFFKLSLRKLHSVKDTHISIKKFPPILPYIKAPKFKPSSSKPFPMITYSL